MVRARRHDTNGYDIATLRVAEVMGQGNVMRSYRLRCFGLLSAVAILGAVGTATGASAQQAQPAAQPAQPNCQMPVRVDTDAASLFSNLPPDVSQGLTGLCQRLVSAGLVADIVTRAETRGGNSFAWTAISVMRGANMVTGPALAFSTTGNTGADAAVMAQTRRASLYSALYQLDTNLNTFATELTREEARLRTVVAQGAARPAVPAVNGGCGFMIFANTDALQTSLTSRPIPLSPEALAMCNQLQANGVGIHVTSQTRDFGGQPYAWSVVRFVDAATGIPSSVYATGTAVPADPRNPNVLETQRDATAAAISALIPSFAQQAAGFAQELAQKRQALRR